MPRKTGLSPFAFKRSRPARPLPFAVWEWLGKGEAMKTHQVALGGLWLAWVASKTGNQTLHWLDGVILASLGLAWLLDHRTGGR